MESLGLQLACFFSLSSFFIFRTHCFCVFVLLFVLLRVFSFFVFVFGLLPFHNFISFEVMFFSCHVGQIFIITLVTVVLMSSVVSISLFITLVSLAR